MASCCAHALITHAPLPSGASYLGPDASLLLQRALQQELQDYCGGVSNLQDTILRLAALVGRRTFSRAFYVVAYGDQVRANT